MILGLASFVVVFCLIKFAEKLRRDHHLRPEVTRKFVHMTVGSFVAFWPFFMSDWLIYFACLAFIAVVLASRYLGWFHSIHGIERRTWGDILFPIGIALTLFFANSEWIFVVAMLHLGLADGLAALIGEKWGKKTVYKVAGYKKSIVGNVAFFITSAMIMSVLIFVLDVGFSQLGFAGLIWVPLFATFFEAVSVKGLDNIVVPVMIVVMLNMLMVVG